MVNRMTVFRRFDLFTAPSHARMLKPRPEAFDHALEALAQSEAASVVLLDNQCRRNVAGGEA
jgi:FMN phosphatase YigB (HAD superfamily)